MVLFASNVFEQFIRQIVLMKRLPAILIKKPLILGAATFLANLFLSITPALILHQKHISQYLNTEGIAELLDTKILVEQQHIVYSTLFYSVIFSLIMAGFVVLLASYLKQSYLEVENLSHYDGLTGLYNRLMFLTVFEKEIQKVQRSHQELFFVILDIDNFKPINDTYGHLIGDEAIKTTAKTLQNLLRASDTIARFGGDEFVICLVDDNKEAASVVVNRILNEFNNKTIPVTRNLDYHDLQINLSIGYTSYKSEDDYKTMLQRADQALYISKEAGKNTATYLA